MARRLDPNDPILQDPAYPHGEVRGYRRGCSCVPCKRANAADSARRDPARKRKPVRDVKGAKIVPPPEFHDHLARLLDKSTASAVGKAADVNPATVRLLAKDEARTKVLSEVTINKIMGVTVAQVRSRRGRLDTGPCQRHIEWLCEQVPGAAAPAIAAACGLTREEVQRVRNGERTYLLTHNALAIMGVTVQQVRQHLRLVPPKRAVQQIRSLQAQDWRLRTLARRLGYTTTGLPFLYGYDAITVDLADRIDALAREIGDRRGDCPRSGRAARKMGWHPAICYDENGDLIPDSVRDETTDRQSTYREHEARRNRNWLRTAALIVEGGLCHAEIAAIVGCSSKDVERRKAAKRGENGLGYTTHPEPDVLADLIVQAAKGIDIHERSDLFDGDVDYKAAWRALMDASWALRDAAEDGEAAA